MLFDIFDILSEVIADETLVSTCISLCLNPPIEQVSSMKVLTKQKGIGLPPQPKEEMISIDILKKKLKVKDPVSTFLAIDQVISLLPYRTLLKFRSSETKNKIETLEIWIKRLKPSIDALKKVTIKDLKPEDSVKQRILLIAPSQRQFNIVKGRWREWAWKEKTYNGKEAPDEKEWLENCATICAALKENGVRAIVVVDRDVTQRAKEVISNAEIVEIDIPKGMAKIGYPRDQSVTWFDKPLIGNMALEIRKGEEEVLNEIYWALGCLPCARFRWATMGKHLVRAKMEGGNFFLLKSDEKAVLLTGIGVRGSNYATFKILADLMPEHIRLIGIPLAGYLRKWEMGAVHLDVVFGYIGEVEGHKWALVDPSRMGFYAALEYDRKKEAFNLIELSQIAKELEITLEEPPRENASKITMTNALNLGNGKLLVDKVNDTVNKYIEEELHVELIEVEIPQMEAGGGGPRCATRELL